MSTELKLSAPDLDELSAAVSGLGIQEKLLVECTEDFFSIIPELQKNLPDTFLWAPLIAGPDVWKGEIWKTSDESLHESVIGYMSYDHKRCDELYAEAEAAWNEGNPELAAEKLKSFDLGMKRHLGEEENILFPAFAEATGMVGGPVQVMLMEHDQMRGVLTQISEAMAANDMDTAIALGDTMVILMQQHNVKEEGILYPMIEQHIEGSMQEKIRSLQTYIAS